MIHIVTHANRHLYGPQMAEMHALRRMGAGPVGRDGGDGHDGFDDVLAVYFMALGAHGEIQCCLRARPSLDRNYLEMLFPDLIDRPEEPLQGREVWTSGRFLLPPGPHALVKNPGVWRTSDVILAAMEHACRAGASRIVGVATQANFVRMRAANLNIRALGSPRRVEGVELVAIETAISPEDIEAFRRTMGRVGWSGYEVDEEDLQIHGALARIERVFDQASRAPLVEPEKAETAIAWAERNYRILG
jgi:N-acyl-L-homoserine lactone synthetase